jgi:hypothetical protein
MDYDYDKEGGEHTFHWDVNSTSASTFGGECSDGNHDFDAYGISFGDNLTLYSIPSSEFKTLAVQMLNHLMRNGHNFKFVENPLEGVRIEAV